MKRIYKGYYFSHYDYWHKHIGASFDSNRRAMEFYINFVHWCTKQCGVEFVIQLFWFKLTVSCFPTYGWKWDGRRLNTLGIDGRLIKKAYRNT